MSNEAVQQTVESPNDEMLLHLCAIRYTLGRNSYIVGEGQRWAREIGRRSKRARDILICDLEEASERHDRGVPALGREMDATGWRAVLSELKGIA